jgi:hypothetical protein
MENNEKLMTFLGKEAIYDDMSQKIWAKHADGGLQMLADIRGWGAIQNLFKEKDGSINELLATNFQDEMGRWITEAINEKMTLSNSSECKHTVDDLLYKKNGIAKCQCGDEWHFDD